MRRWLMVAMVLGLVLSPMWVNAQSYVICAPTNYEPDTVTLGLINIVPGDDDLYAVTLRWKAIPNFYEMEGTGTIAINFPEDTHYVLQPIPMMLQNRSAYFGGNPNCALRASATLALQGQPNGWNWSMVCTGGPGAIFSVSGTWTLESCSPTFQAMSASSTHSVQRERAAGE